MNRRTMIRGLARVVLTAFLMISLVLLSSCDVDVATAPTTAPTTAATTAPLTASTQTPTSTNTTLTTTSNGITQSTSPGPTQSTSQSLEDAALQAKRAALNVDTIYPGIAVNGIPLGGMTRAAVSMALAVEAQKLHDTFQVELTVTGDDQPTTVRLTPEQAGWTVDTATLVEKAWMTGRTTTAASEREQINERYAIVEQLKQQPLDLPMTATVNLEQARVALAQAIAALARPARNASATGFDLATKTFDLAKETSGFKIDATVAIMATIARLAAGQFNATTTVAGELVAPAVTTKQLQARLGLVSTATTLAGSGSNASRDHNIALIIQGLNGMVIQPGAAFSFNGRFGRRTAAKGFQDAPGIINGVLVPTIGGGICQPNTTLFQAVLMADLQIVDRSPHSWPSAYTRIGLDATVNWPSPDFKFRNNTTDPVAIVASFHKPNVVVSIYGRSLGSGVSISLTSEHTGYEKPPSPRYITNNSLAPGTTKVVREAHDGQRATTYKLWRQNGKVVRRVFAFTSTYYPIQAIIEVGPPVPTLRAPG